MISRFSREKKVVYEHISPSFLSIRGHEQALCVVY